MFTRRSLFKFLAAAPVAAAIEAPAAMPPPPPLPKLAVPPPPPLHTMGMGDYVSARFIVPQNPIPGSESGLLGDRAFGTYR